MGAWTPISYFSGREYPTEADAIEAARLATPWVGAVLDVTSTSDVTKTSDSA